MAVEMTAAAFRAAFDVYRQKGTSLHEALEAALPHMRCSVCGNAAEIERVTTQLADDIVSGRYEGREGDLQKEINRIRALKDLPPVEIPRGGR